MDGAIDLSLWGGFLSAEAGAAATLAGLLFVGVSLNLTKILAFQSLVRRALLALLTFLTILVLASLLLIPARTANTIGLELILVGGAIWLYGTVVEVDGWRRKPTLQNRTLFLLNALLFEAATIPYVVAGALILNGDMAGLGWFSIAVVLCFIKGVVDSWVLLVEVNR